MEITAPPGNQASAAPVVLVVRDPDDFLEIVQDGVARVITIDLGYAMNGLDDIGAMDPVDGFDTLNSWLQEVASLPVGNRVRMEVEDMAAEGAGYITVQEDEAEFQLLDISDQAGEETGIPTILVIRDPDEANMYTVDREPGDPDMPRIIDIDLGASIDGLRGLAELEREEAVEMIEDWEKEVEDLPEGSKVRQAVLSLVASAWEYVTPAVEAPGDDDDEVEEPNSEKREL